MSFNHMLTGQIVLEKITSDARLREIFAPLLAYFGKETFDKVSTDVNSIVLQDTADGRVVKIETSGETSDELGRVIRHCILRANPHVAIRGCLRLMNFDLGRVKHLPFGRTIDSRRHALLKQEKHDFIERLGEEMKLDPNQKARLAKKLTDALSAI